MVKTVEIVSLSRGVLGEDFLAHELKLGTERLEKMGLSVRFSENALKGLEYIEKHPEERAKDLIAAFENPEVDMILCAIGGDDTYRLLPYLFANDELKKAVQGKNKIFLGYSDTTINHFMLHSVGVKTFYGQSFLADICELGSDIMPYTRKYFEELIKTGTIAEIRPSDIWYDGRTDFSVSQLGVDCASHENQGFELLQGAPRFSGKILGGCIDSIYDIFNGERYEDMPVLCEKYGLFPKATDWEGRILLLESSEEKPSPEKYEKALLYLKNAGVFDVISGVLVGKPMDETYYSEYKDVLIKTIGNSKLPILYNINIGHATPHCIMPFGVNANVDAEKQIISFE